MSEANKHEEKQLSLQRFLDALPEAFLVINTRGCICEVNRSACELGNYLRKEVINRPVTDMVVATASDNFLRHVFEIAVAGKTRFQAALHRGDTRLVEVMVGASATRIDDEFLFLVSLQDLGEQKRVEQQMRELQEHLQLQIQRMPIGLIVWDNEFCVRSWNPAATRIFGFSAEEAWGRHPYDLIVPKDVQPQVDDIWRRLLEGDDTAHSVNENFTKDGLTIICDWSNTPLRRPDGSVIGVLSMVQDITELRHAEEETHKEREKLHAIFRCIGEGVVTTDLEGRVIQANPVALRMHGFSNTEEVRGRSAFEFISPRDHNLAVKGLNKTLTDGHSGVLEFTFLTNDRREFPGELVAALLKDKSGNPTGFVAVTRDVTERKKSETKLVLRAQLLDAASDSIMLYDPLGNFIYINEAGHKSRGYGKEELMAMNRRHLATPEFAALFDARIERIMTEGRAVFESVHCRKDGSTMPVEIHARLINVGGKDCIISVCRDITERKCAERRISHLNMVLRAVRGVNQLITREKDRQCLIESSCSLLVSTRGFEMAWGLLSDDRGNPVVVAAAGLGAESKPFLGQLKAGNYPYCARQLGAQESPMLVYDQQPSQHGNCVLAGDHCNQGVFVCRLEYGGKVYGEMAVGVSSEAVTSEEEKGLFLELCNDISYALGAIEREEQHGLTEQALQSSEEKLRLTFESVTNGVAVTDLNGTIEKVNHAMIVMHGYHNTEELVGRSISELISAKDRAVMAEVLRDSLAKGYRRGVVLACRRKDGSEFSGELSVSILRDARFSPAGFICIVEDITELKWMQEQLIVTDRLASIGELASGIAHELNNPLTSVIGFSQLLLGKDIPADIKEDVKIISKEAERTAQIVKNLLTFARKHPPVRTLVNVHEIIEKVLEIRAYEQKVNNIRVVTQFASDLPEITADQFQLQQVFLNIVINAEYFMDKLPRPYGRGFNLSQTSFALHLFPMLMFTTFLL